MVTKRAGRGVLTAVLYCLPVTAVIVALFVAPSSTGAARASLNVSPDSGVYGGQQLTFSGAVGAGNQAIWLQRRGAAGAAWADVPDSIPKPWTTDGAGRFRFTFHAPAMNTVQFRVVSRTAATESHTFRSEQQEADLLVREISPASVKWPTETVIEPLPRGFAIDGEPYSVRVDSVNRANDDKKPVLLGRTVTLERRQADNSWQEVTTDALDAAGLADFASGHAKSSGIYRAVLEDWTRNGDDVGWFPSVPFYLSVVERPDPVTELAAVATTSSSVTLRWTLPADPVAKIVVVRGFPGGVEPTWATPNRFVIKELAGSAPGYTDRAQISPNRGYRYAVYTVSNDGVYSEVADRVDASTPAATRGERR